MAITNGPNLGLAVNGAQGDEHFDELMAQWRGLDALVQPTAVSASTSAQPGSPTDGDLYIVPTGATGAAWSGQDGKLARYSSAVPGWEFYAPREGWRVFVRDVNSSYVYSGSAWIVETFVDELALSRRFAGSVNTTDDTPTTIITIPLPSGATMLVEVNAIGKTATPDLTSLRKTASFKNVGGTVSLVGTATTVHAQADSGLNAADLLFTPSGNNVLVQVQGVAATNLAWKARAITTDN